jgi:hypothetical protein
MNDSITKEKLRQEENELLDGSTTELMKILSLIVETDMFQEIHYMNKDKQLSITAIDSDGWEYNFERKDNP